jgi:DNA-binding transcriptional MerR regulator
VRSQDESVPEDSVMGIGDFAVATGLSVPRLRRYHEAGLLVPARVDPSTGYRSYTVQQVEDGRRIARLRAVDLPLDDLEQVVRGSSSIAALLRRHRRRLEARIITTRRMVELTDQLINEERTRMSSTTVQLMEITLRVDDVDATVAFYRQVFGMDFQADDHCGAAPLHYDACGGSWDPEGFFMFTIYPAGERAATTTSIGFGVPNVDDVWSKALEAGATALEPPVDPDYIPRLAAFSDPAGNTITVYQRAGDW